MTLFEGRRDSPEQVDEVIRLLREANRLSEARFTGLDSAVRDQHVALDAIREPQLTLDVAIRQQHLETPPVLHAVYRSLDIPTAADGW